MRFSVRKNRQPPAVIIVSLIDILIVLLIFLMVTTTFKQQPALQLTLPESAHARAGASESHVVVTIAKQAPYLYLGPEPVTSADLERQLLARAAQQPDLRLSIQADAEAPFGQIVRVMDIAKTARIKTVSAVTKTVRPPSPAPSNP